MDSSFTSTKAFVLLISNQIIFSIQHFQAEGSSHGNLTFSGDCLVNIREGPISGSTPITNCSVLVNNTTMVSNNTAMNNNTGSNSTTMGNITAQVNNNEMDNRVELHIVKWKHQWYI